MNIPITRKERWATYLIFLLMGMSSYPFSLFLGVLLSNNLSDLQNILCNAGLCALDMPAILGGYIFPMVFCSLLFAMGIYAFKEQSFLFALKIFAISSATLLLIFSAGILLLGLNYFSGYFLPLVFLLILSAAGSIIFKEKTNVSFILRSYAIFFLGLTLAFSAFFVVYLVGFQGGGCGMGVEEIKTPLNKFQYVELNDAELDEYPALKKATAIEGHSLDMNSTEWEQTREFLDKKWSERSDLFVINERDIEEELNQSTITAEMKNVFASEGYPISENSYIMRNDDRWYIIKRYYLFSMTDPEIEEELNRINITSEEIIQIRLKNAFDSNGFSLPEGTIISRNERGWIIDAGTGYTILKEEGRMNVYTGDEKTYDIFRGDGKFKVVYVGPQWSPVFKIRERYYEFSFWVS